MERRQSRFHRKDRTIILVCIVARQKYCTYSCEVLDGWRKEIRKTKRICFRSLLTHRLQLVLLCCCAAVVRVDDNRSQGSRGASADLCRASTRKVGGHRRRRQLSIACVNGFSHSDSLSLPCPALCSTAAPPANWAWWLVAGLLSYFCCTLFVLLLYPKWALRGRIQRRRTRIATRRCWGLGDGDDICSSGIGTVLL